MKVEPARLLNRFAPDPRNTSPTTRPSLLMVSLPLVATIALAETAEIEPEVVTVLFRPPSIFTPTPAPEPPRTVPLDVTVMLPPPSEPRLWAKMPTESVLEASTRPDRFKLMAPPRPTPPAAPANAPSTQPPPPPSDWAIRP